MSIEIKIAESWSLNQLIEALQDQLVGQYLSQVNSRYGVLLLCSMGTPRVEGWKNDDHQLGNFADLVEYLDTLAKDIAKQRADIAALSVLGIDFH